MAHAVGDANAKVGQGRQEDTVGPLGIGMRNARVESFVEWYVEEIVVVHSQRVHKLVPRFRC